MKLINADQLAKYLGVSYCTVRRLTISGSIPFTRIGWQYRYDLNKVLETMEKTTTQGSKKEVEQWTV